METLLAAKTSYMLEAGIDVLHRESLEWLEEIAFWRDETAFFSALIITKTKKQVPIDAKDPLRSVENHLVHVGINKLEDLEKQVTLHEHNLAYVLEQKFPDENIYREKHRDIAKKIHAFEAEYKDMKKKVFALVERLK